MVLTGDCATGWWCGRRLGLRRVSDAVKVGRRVALWIPLDALDTTTGAAISQGAGSAAVLSTRLAELKSVRRRTCLVAVCIDMICTELQTGSNSIVCPQLVDCRIDVTF